MSGLGASGQQQGEELGRESAEAVGQRSTVKGDSSKNSKTRGSKVVGWLVAKILNSS